MLSGNGYDQAVDVWAVGVLIFEMIFGYAPFGQVPDEIEKAIASSEMCSQGVAESASAGAERESSDFAATIVRPPERHTAQVTMKRIMFDDITFPPDTVVPIDSDNRTKDIVMSLLVKRPEHRLGCAKAGGIANVYRHEWFEGFDLRAMQERRMESPWKPDLDKDHEVVEPAENYSWDFPIKEYTGDHSWCEGW